MTICVANLVELAKDVLAVDDLPLVSSDIIGGEESAIVTSQVTQLIGDRFVKVLAWYDNEWTFSRRCVDIMQKMVEPCWNESTPAGLRSSGREGGFVPLHVGNPDEVFRLLRSLAGVDHGF